MLNQFGNLYRAASTSLLNATLLNAATNGSAFMVKKACELGADVNTTNSKGETALHLAAKAGAVDVVQYLCEHGANLIATTKPFTEVITEISVGCARSNYKTTENRFQVEMGGSTALHYAVIYEKPEVVRTLCIQGADVTALDHSGNTPADKISRYVSIKNILTDFSGGKDIYNTNKPARQQGRRNEARDNHDNQEHPRDRSPRRNHSV